MPYNPHNRGQRTDQKMKKVFKKHIDRVYEQVEALTPMLLSTGFTNLFEMANKLTIRDAYYPATDPNINRPAVVNEYTNRRTAKLRYAAKFRDIIKSDSEDTVNLIALFLYHRHLKLLVDRREMPLRKEYNKFINNALGFTTKIT